MIWLALAAASLAQTLDAHGFSVSDGGASPELPIRIPAAVPHRAGSGWGAMLVEYADAPWIQDVDGRERTRLSNLVALDLGVGWAPVERVQLSLAAPFFLASRDARNEPQWASLGDLRLGLQGAVAARGPHSAGIAAYADLPTGAAGQLLGQSGPGVELVSTATTAAEGARATAAAGAALRPDVGAARTVHRGDALVAYLGGAARLGALSWLGLEGRFDRPFDPVAAELQGIGLELLLTLRTATASGGHLMALVGTSPSPAAGAPPLRIAIGGGFGTRPPPEPEPEAVATPEPEPAPARGFSVEPEGASVWLPHPICRWIPVSEAGPLLSTLPPSTAVQLSAPGYLPRSVELGSGGAALDPAPIQGGLVVVADPGDRVWIDDTPVQTSSDGVTLANVPEGVHAVKVEGGGRLFLDEAATTSGYAVWLRAPEPTPIRVPFAAGSSALGAAARAELAPLLDHLGHGRFELVGSHSPEGRDPDNERLARARAEAVAAYLSSRGVPSDQIAIAEPAPPGPELTADQQRSVLVVPRGAP